jgi:hypothetical protein
MCGKTVAKIDNCQVSPVGGVVLQRPRSFTMGENSETGKTSPCIIRLRSKCRHRLECQRAHDDDITPEGTPISYAAKSPNIFPAQSKLQSCILKHSVPNNPKGHCFYNCAADRDKAS